MSRSPARLRHARALLCAALAVPFAVTAALVTAPSAGASKPVPPAAVANPTNPLAKLSWGHESEPITDGAYPPYLASSGINRLRLGRVALRPRAHWFGPWNSKAQVAQTVHTYIAEVTGGSPNVLVQMAIFRLSPWEGSACHHVYTSAEQASYKDWIDRVAGAIGSTHVALILQPDLPFAYCTANPSQPLALVNYAARKFSSLPHTAVFIDVGAADWYSAEQAVGLLRPAGIAYTRGFAVNATHYDSVYNEIMYGSQIVAALNHLGIRNRHFVISTAQDGRPFTTKWFRSAHPGMDYNNAPACTTSTQLRCVTLGIPPTYHVVEGQWLLPYNARMLATYQVDGYLWIGRPWLLGTQFSPTKTYNENRTLTISRTTPFWRLSSTTMP